VTVETGQPEPSLISARAGGSADGNARGDVAVCPVRRRPSRSNRHDGTGWLIALAAFWGDPAHNSTAVGVSPTG
jgi:hypothetical protein